MNEAITRLIDWTDELRLSRAWKLESVPAFEGWQVTDVETLEHCIVQIREGHAHITARITKDAVADVLLPTINSMIGAIAELKKQELKKQGL